MTVHPQLRRLSPWASSVAVIVVAVIIANYNRIDTHPSHGKRVDVIIVLGNPAASDGTPGSEQRERVFEAAREYRRGISSHVIFSGAAVYNRYVEASVMAQLAHSLSLPEDAILIEPQARNTIQNIFYSAEMMHAHGWRSAEIVSSPSHLPRTALILEAFDREQPELAIDWTTHPSPPQPGHQWFRGGVHHALEEAYCLRLRLFGFPRTGFLPGP